MDRKMDKYIKLEDAIDLFWTVDPENNGDDGCTVVLKCGSYDSNEIETLLSELPTIEIAPPNEPLTQAELNEMYLNEVCWNTRTGAEKRRLWFWGRYIA